MGLASITLVLLALTPIGKGEDSSNSTSSATTGPEAPQSTNSSSLLSPSPPPPGTNFTTPKKAWSSPNNTFRLITPYSSEMLTRLVKSYHDLTSTNDPINEEYYSYSRLGDNVWYNVERVAPYKMYMDWALNTNDITSRYDSSGKSLINNYIQVPNTESCSPESSFEMDAKVIKSDDKRLRIQLDSQIHSWFIRNANTPPERMCNRFRGLVCSSSKGICECEGGSSDSPVHYVQYTRTRMDPPGEYRDGCYTKPWRKCQHLSVDANIQSEYKAFHAHKNNMKEFLIRMATPLPRTSRCEKGTYCVDMILNQHNPICWCASRMHNKECYKLNGSVPMLSQFLEVRKQFHQKIILEREREAKCVVDPEITECLEGILRLMKNVEQNWLQILNLMKQVLRRRGRFCDFRKGMACDPYKKTCTYRTGCGSGRVEDKMTKVCRVNNGYPCPTIELQCVFGAQCLDFGGGRHCHCQSKYFGELCHFEGSSFFGGLLQSRISGYVGFHFVNLQEVVNNVLTPLERLMTLGHNQNCNPSLDSYAMQIVKYLGNVRIVNVKLMDASLSAAQFLVGRDEEICDYRKFLRCTVSGICEPMIPDVARYEVRAAPGFPDDVRIYLKLMPRSICSGPGIRFAKVPEIFQDVIHVQCLPNHECRSWEGRIGLKDKYCLCPMGYQGISCGEKVPVVRAVVQPRSLSLPENDGKTYLIIAPSHGKGIIRVGRKVGW